MNLVQTQQESAFENLKGDFSYRNVSQSPRVEKVVISTGTGNIIHATSRTKGVSEDTFEVFLERREYLGACRVLHKKIEI